MKKLVLISIFSLLMLSAGAQEDGKDAVVATVNGVKITKAEFDEAYQQNLLYVSNMKVTKEKVLNDLINREIGIKVAKQGNLQNDPIVKRKMEDVLYHAQVSKDLEPELKKIQVSDDEVKKYYNDNKEYRVSHILFRMRATPSKEEEEAARAQADKVYAELKESPDKFSELAKKYSQSSTAATGGDMGFQPAIRLAPEFFQAINGKDKGFLSHPVKTQYGYHIIKIIDIKDYKSISTELYKKIIYDQKRDAILANYFRNLRKSASIDINKKLIVE